MKLFLPLLFLLSFLRPLRAQDTFSILAFDSLTREVGAAGASCLDLFPFPAFSNDFITELFPDSGATACQASYISTNQVLQRNRVRAGDTPTMVIDYLINNDAQNNATVRQYGVVSMLGPGPHAAAFTGTNCMNYKNHIVGPNYTIHGNILLGQKVLDSMEARFKRAKGDLACKLMAAMQGAKMVGADTRCANNNTSSLFAFLKVMQPTDTFGKPSFIVSLKTHNGDSIEPIDSLQKLFSAKRTCTVISVGAIEKIKPGLIDIFPNPAGGMIKIKAAGAAHISFIDITGRIVLERDFEDEISIDTTILTQGIYLATVSSGETRLTRRIVISGM